MEIRKLIKTKNNMEVTVRNCIFFGDFTEKAQARLIEDVTRSTLQKLFAVRSIYIDPEFYGGYNEKEPQKTTLEQHVYAKLVEDGDMDRKSKPYMLVWECNSRRFLSVEEIDEWPVKVEGTIGKSLKVTDFYIPKPVH